MAGGRRLRALALLARLPLSPHRQAEEAGLRITLGATLMASGHRVLVHCSTGFNRSALVAGLILTETGLSGREALARVREQRPGALFNDTFAEFLARQNMD